MKLKQGPELIAGGSAIDVRGKVAFVNDFSFAKVKRFYMVSNHRAGYVRAWHGHKKEGKYVLAVAGSAMIGAVQVTNWKNPDKNTQVQTFVLSQEKPAILFIPPGYANGFMSLTVDCKLMFFSTRTIEQSRGDDFRFDSRYWDIWNIKEY